MSDAEERESYRDRLAAALRQALGGNDRHHRISLVDAVMAVRDAELDRLSQENDRLAAKVDDLEGAALEDVDERDRLERLLDQFAYAVAPVEVIGEHSSGNDPWQNALDMLAPASERDEQQRRAERAEAQLAEAREQLRLANIDAVTNEAQLNAADKKIEDISSSLDRVRQTATEWQNPDGETGVYAPAIGAHLLAILDNPPPGDTPEPGHLPVAASDDQIGSTTPEPNRSEP